MASYTSTQSGTWDDAATWGGGGFPTIADNATIADTHTVTLDSDEEVFDLDVQAGGTLALSSWMLRIDGSITFGTTSDVTGTGIFRVASDGTAETLTNNKTGAFSFTGTVQPQLFGQNRMAITGDWSNANYHLNSTSAVNRNFLFTAGTLKCKDLSVINSNTGQITVTNSTNNPNIEASGTIDLNAGAGVYTTVWTAGSGTMKLTGTAQSIDLNGQTVETITSDADIGNVSILSADTWDIDTLDLTTSNLTVNGTLTIGVTAATGLTTADLTFAAGSAADLQTTSKIVLGGNYSCDNSAIWSNSNRGDVTITTSANYISPNVNNLWYNLTLNAGVTTTLTGTSQFTNNMSNDTVINGTIATGGNIFKIGAGTTGSVTIGVNADFTGAGTFQFDCQSAATVTNNKTTACSITNKVVNLLNITSAKAIVCDFSNANYIMSSGSASDRFFVPSSGTLKCKDFTVTSSNTGQITVTNTTDNPSFEISGDIDLNAGAGVYTTVWTKGTGTMTLTGSAGTQTIASDSQSLEDIIINASGATKQIITTALTTESFLLTAGTIDHNTLDFTTGGNYRISAGGLNTDVGLNGMTLTVGGNYIVLGQPGTLLDLGAGAGWTLTITGTGRASYVTVKNSNAGGGSPVSASASTDEGSNTNWSFITPGVGNYYNPGIKVTRKTQVLIA
jgi:hypothetical protein